MTVTAKLHQLYLIDQQLRGLGSRLKAAEAYLGEQERLLSEQETKVATLGTQMRQLEASAKNFEVEAAALEERMVKLRDRMNSARTSKEHGAYLTEISTIKADKKLVEDQQLEAMAKFEALRTQHTALETDRNERRGVRTVAAQERDARAAEIKDRVEELKAQRARATQLVPGSALTVYEERLALEVEFVMAPVEEQDRRNMEYTCGACCTHLPIEPVSVLLRRGDLTRCPSCEAILYIEAGLREDITTSREKGAKGKKKTAAVDE